MDVLFWLQPANSRVLGSPRARVGRVVRGKRHKRRRRCCRSLLHEYEERANRTHGANVPNRLRRYALRDEEPAPGKWRSGIGIVRVNRMLVPTIVSCEGDRSLDPPWGIFDGKDGRPGALTRIWDGGREVWDSKFTGRRLASGEKLENQITDGRRLRESVRTSIPLSFWKMFSTNLSRLKKQKRIMAL